MRVFTRRVYLSLRNAPRVRQLPAASSRPDASGAKAPCPELVSTAAAFTAASAGIDERKFPTSWNIHRQWSGWM